MNTQSHTQTRSFRNWFDRNFPDPDNPDNAYTRAVLDQHKREGLELAVKARWVALAVIAVMIPLLNPRPEALYYEVMLLAVAGFGWLQRRVGRVGLSRVELIVLFCDLALMTIILAFPNPFSQEGLEAPLTYRFGTFIYFFVILAAGTLAFSWRTLIAIGTWTAVLWTTAAVFQWWIAVPDPELTQAMAEIPGLTPRMMDLLDPNRFLVENRIQEVVVFVIVALTLGISMRRFNWLLMGNATLERERANLSRYFSPNVVEELSNNDEPLKQIRKQGVAVMFVDIVGFTEYAVAREPEQIIETLREFHSLMETEIFRYNGTLDKFLGDGLMATFGTPLAGETDSLNALQCARAMMRSMDAWNETRVIEGESEIVASIGLHYGPVVLGDIGQNRLEFAVIGNTVNVASRLEALTRNLSARLVVSHDLVTQIRKEMAGSANILEDLKKAGEQKIRGVPDPMLVWSLP